MIYLIIGISAGVINDAILCANEKEARHKASVMAKKEYVNPDDDSVYLMAFGPGDLGDTSFEYIGPSY